MKKPILFLATILFALVSYAQTSENREVSGFSRIEVGGAFNVYLSAGSSEAVRIEADEDDLGNIITEVRGNTLEVKARRGVNNVKGDVYITYKSIDELHCSGASAVTTENPIKTSDFELHCSGASEIELALEVDDLEIHASGASQIELSGKAINQEIHLSGAGTLDAFELEGENAEVSASGAGKIRINVNGTLNVRASGATSVRYRGNPDVESVKISGAGSVSKE